MTLSGPLQVVLSLCKSLVENKELKIRLIALRKTDNQEALNRFSLCLGRLNIYEIAEKTSLRTLYKQSKIIDKIIQNDAKEDNIILHSHCMLPDICCYFLAKKYKCVSTIHNIAFQDYPSHRWILGYFQALLHLSALKLSKTKIVTISNTVYNKGKFFFSNKKVIYNGIDTSRFFTTEDYNKQELRESLKIGKNSRIFISCSSFYKLKRVPELINWFISHAHTEKDQLLILGYGSDQEVENIKKQIAAYPFITFLGRVTNPEKYYQISDYIIANSKSEGFGLSVIEAILCGCKAILSDIPVFRELQEVLPNSIIMKDDFNFDEEIKWDKEDCLTQFSSKYTGTQYLDFYKRI